MTKKSPAKNLKEIEPSPIDSEILEKLDEILSPEILAIMKTQITSGPYPPPNMMAEYKEKCPEVYEQIVKGVEEQRNHRIALEAKQVADTSKILEKSERSQSYISYWAIAGAVGIIVLQLVWFNRVDHWYTSAILAALAVGGKPVATIIAEIIAAFSRKSKSSRQEDKTED